MSIAAILPCRGRREQTVQNVKRLLATAGTDDWRLYAVGGREDADVLTALAKNGVATFTAQADRLTYWQALAEVTNVTSEPLIVCLANDLLPGMHWLRRAVEAYRQTFGTGLGMIGFNGDSHELEHSCHFLIHRDLLARYGGWPVWYQHNFGDTEICQRAIEMGAYAKAPWSILFHNHHYFGAANNDEIYRQGEQSVARDQHLFEHRRKMGWPSAAPDLDTQILQSALEQPSYMR